MNRIKKFFLVLIVLITLLAYGSVLVSPSNFRFSAWASLFIPPFMLISLILCLRFLFKRSYKALIFGVLLALGYPFLRVAYGFGSEKGSNDQFSLINYNVKSLSYSEQDDNIISFIKQMDADIVCMQEFRGARRIIPAMNPAGKYHTALADINHKLVILSKFPILQDELLFDQKGGNNILAADLLVGPADTVRVYNVHLQSMGIDTSELQDTENMKKDYEQAKTKFMEGASRRAGQVSILLKHIEDCPYPVLLAGDFNDVPFSYNYFRLRRKLNNSFEKAGTGFGFTFNGRLPFLRIDNQFFSDQIEINSFKTLDDINYSDHFPLLGTYTISN